MMSQNVWAENVYQKRMTARTKWTEASKHNSEKKSQDTEELYL